MDIAGAVVFQPEQVTQGNPQTTEKFANGKVEKASYWRNSTGEKEGSYKIKERYEGKKEKKEVYAMEGRKEKYAETAKEVELAKEVKYWKARAEKLEKGLGDVLAVLQAGLAASQAVGHE